MTCKNPNVIFRVRRTMYLLSEEMFKYTTPRLGTIEFLHWNKPLLHKCLY